ncbi:MAG: response regulator transcription factor [Candidatus Omnitrophica bacterium]|nr:response regulator transcription factor [Candidatus Omnitrophota bacterium]
MKASILLIEDEKNIIELVRYNLEQEGYKVFVSTRGNTGAEEAIRRKPSLIILDLMLPEMNGLDVCKTLKANDMTAAIPVVMLTAKSEEADKIVGLELGADDYITKPFSPRELLARVKAVLRRSQEKPKEKTLKAGDLEVDTGKHIVTVKGKTCELTSKEFDLLQILMEARGRVLTREVLLDKIWGYEPSLNIETRTVDMHIGQLRKKIRSESPRIVTVKNVGYRFDDES